MEIAAIVLRIMEVIGLLVMLSSIFFAKEGLRPSFNPKRWFPRGGFNQFYRRPGAHLWRWGFGVFLITRMALWVMEGRAGTSEAGVFTPENIFIIFIVTGCLSFVGSLFFLQPNQEIVPGDIGSGKEARKIRAWFRHPGYILARNGVFFAIVGLVAIMAVRLG